MNNNSAKLPVRVMVVDDSAVIRGLVTRWLSEPGDIDVVSSVSDGEKAVEAYPATTPDVVIMDIEMPVLDGIAALQQILKIDDKAKIIMSSSLTRRNADISLKALALGASDYLTKPLAKDELHKKSGFQFDLIEKVRALGSARQSERGAAAGVAASSLPRTRKSIAVAPKESAKIVLSKQSSVMPRILAIGSSTGGPQALFSMFKEIKNIGRLPIVITQHMPATFTAIFAEHLARASGLPCEEGKDGEVLRNGHIYIAPGDYHMVIEDGGAEKVIRLNQKPQENYCRPAVDPLFRSLSSIYGSAILAVVLTGMGHDGAKGAKIISDAGGTIIAQDEETSVVWGMPGAVANAGICSAVLPIEQISGAVSKVCVGGRL